MLRFTVIANNSPPPTQTALHDHCTGCGLALAESAGAVADQHSLDPVTLDLRERRNLWPSTKGKTSGGDIHLRSRAQQAAPLRWSDPGFLYSVVLG